MSVVIKTEHLSCQSGRRFLIHDINWEVQKGDHWIIFGMNGCGKTTLLSTVAGFRGYTEGNLEVFGEPYRSDNIFSHRNLLRRALLCPDTSVISPIHIHTIHARTLLLRRRIPFHRPPFSQLAHQDH